MIPITRIFILAFVVMALLSACGGGDTPQVLAPSISSFQASASIITIGDSAVLTPVFQNGSGSIDNNVGSVVSGSDHPVSPTSNTVYTLTVQNSQGTSTTQQVEIQVVDPPVANASPGGFWRGVSNSFTDPASGDLYFRIFHLYVTETGRFHLLTGPASQGSGTLRVTNGNDVAAEFQLVTHLQSDDTFADGTTLADCTLSGDIVERQSMVLTVDCDKTLSITNQFSVTLNYDSDYEVQSSLDIIAGNYQINGSGPTTWLQEGVLNVAGDGTLFAQGADTGCVLNGRISIINSTYGVYDVNFTFNNCVGDFTRWNGSSFVGIVFSQFGVGHLFILATGRVDGVLLSFWDIFNKL